MNKLQHLQYLNFRKPSRYADNITAIQVKPSLDLNFARNKRLIDNVTGNNLGTFTRASGGTYVGSDGVLKTATTNLMLYSEQFDNAIWGPVAGTVTANATTAPSGAVTADRGVTNGVSFQVQQGTTITSGATVSGSVFLKADGINEVEIVLLTAGNITPYGRATFNVSTGVISVAAFSTNGGTNASASITAINNGWYRCVVTVTYPATTSAGMRINSPGATGGIFLWGAQLEQSSTVGEYIPTTSTINSAPRFDHNPTTGESLGLLVEEQRTNNIRNNTMVGAVAGTPGTVPTNWVVSTAAGITRELVGVGTENGINYIDYRFSGTATGNSDTQFDGGTVIAALSGQSWTVSAYVKLQAGSLSNATVTQIIAENNAAGGFLAASTQNITPTSSALGQQRASLSRTLNNASTAYVITALRVASAGAIDITLRIGLPQLEQGAFPTSYIPTTTAAATRSADVASVNTLSPWYNATEGTFFCSTFAPKGNVIYGTGDTFDNTQYVTAASSLNVSVRSSNVVSAIITAPVSTTATTNIAHRYAANDFAAVSNGGTIATDTNGAVPLAQVRLKLGSSAWDAGGSNNINGHIRRLTYFPQRISNANLQRITQ